MGYLAQKTRKTRQKTRKTRQKRAKYKNIKKYSKRVRVLYALFHKNTKFQKAVFSFKFVLKVGGKTKRQLT